MENLPDGGFVLAPNHISHARPVPDRALHARQQHLRRGSSPRTRWWAPRATAGSCATAEQIPVYRSTEGAAESLRAASAAVEAGHVVTIYPEGTITRDPAAWPMTRTHGRRTRRAGTGKPLVPLMQWGPQEILWPYAKKLRLFPRKTIHIRVGKPVDLSDFEGKDAHRGSPPRGHRPADGRLDCHDGRGEGRAALDTSHRCAYLEQAEDQLHTPGTSEETGFVNGADSRDGRRVVGHGFRHGAGRRRQRRTSMGAAA